MDTGVERVLGKRYSAIKIGARAIGATFQTYVIAEVGINHNGSLAQAKTLIEAAAGAGCDAVKFQKRSLPELYTQDVLRNPNQFEEAFQYLIPILKEVEFGRPEYDELYRHARRHGLEFLCTPTDDASVDFLAPYHLPAYKVGSSDFTNLLLLEKLIATRQPLILSTGMSTMEEIDEVVEFLTGHHALFMLLHCVSAYPTPPEDVHLNFLQTMRERYGVPVGFSGHEVGMDITVAAVSAGACLVERHITIDRRMKGPDHTSSLEPQDFLELVKRIRVLDRAMGSPHRVLSRIVIRTQEVLSKSLVATRDLQVGTRIQREMVTAKAPGKGLSPLRLRDLIGRTTRRVVRADECFTLEDLQPPGTGRSAPRFETRWGFKGRFGNLQEMLPYQPRLVEIQLSDRDVVDSAELPLADTRYPLALFLHCPIYWYRSVLNLASEDSKERAEHLRAVQQVIELARRLAPNFLGTPSVIIHLGGMDIYKVTEGAELRERAYESMCRLDWDGVNFLPENMPPRPWYFSGQWFDNVFCSAEDMVEVCERFKLQMCLDLSHAKLYTNDTATDYEAYLRRVAPYVAHLHVADAYGIDGEGVQIGDGEIDFARTFALLAELTDLRSVTWTPEIWQGHLHQNRGFLTALERLAAIPQLQPIHPLVPQPDEVMP